MDITSLIPEDRQSAIARDIKLNLGRLLEGQGALSQEGALLAALALARSAGSERLVRFARAELERLGLGAELIQEAEESAAIMGMLNTYYRFKYLIGQSPEVQDRYRSAGLRMQSLARPALGKERFEELAFAVSVLNGCQSCVQAHEKVLLEAGVKADTVHELARLAAVVKAYAALVPES